MNKEYQFYFTFHAKIALPWENKGYAMNCIVLLSPLGDGTGAGVPEKIHIHPLIMWSMIIILV